MSERIVVSFRARAEQARSHDSSVWTDQIRFVLKRAEALGATVCSWGAVTFSLAFLVEDLEELVEFLVDGEVRAKLVDFSIGISQGELTPLVEFRGAVELGRGLPVNHALALARLGLAGDVLLDAAMQAVRRGDLLTLGSKLGRVGGKRIRGFRLDCAQPWRSGAERALENLKEPSVLIGRDDALVQMKVEPGTLAIVRADAGVGGSRFLRECVNVAALEQARTLMVRPTGFGGEPLGALRRALARDVARSEQTNLPHGEDKVLDGILRGLGAEVPAAATLIEQWLSPSGSANPGLVVLDDANEIDAATLDVIAASMMGAVRPFGCIARLDALSPLPAQLAPLPPGPEVELQPLSQSDGEKIAATWLGAAPGDWAATWAVKGAGVPLAIGEAIAEALSSGELQSNPQGVHVRASTGLKAHALPARDWIARRWILLDSEARSLLFAIAVMGGETSLSMADALLRAAADAPVDAERMAQVLTVRGWLVESEPGRIAMRTRTHSLVVLESLPDTRRASWHRAASLIIEAREGELARAEAARQASLANDRRRAARLYIEASRSAAGTLLEAAASDLVSMARSEDPDLTRQAESSWPVQHAARNSFHVPASSFAAALVSCSSRRDRSSYPPIEIPLLQLPNTSSHHPAASLPEQSTVDSPPIPRPPAVPTEVQAKAPPAVPRPNAAPVPRPRRPVPAHLGGETRRRSVNQLAAELPVLARDALTAGDVTALEKWAEREPMTGERERLLKRLKAIISLDRGDKNEAMRVLKDACEHPEGCSHVEQSRAHLALAVGLAQTGRPIEALVEALEALALTRTAADPRGEKACLAFLQKVYGAMGHAQLAQSWTQAAQPG